MLQPRRQPTGRAAGDSSFQQGKLVPGKVKVWDGKTGQELLRLDGHGQGVDSVQYSTDGNRLAAGGSGKATVWDARNGEELLSVSEGLGAGVSACLSANGTRLATFGGKTVKVWDVRPNKSGPHPGGASHP